MEVWIKRSSIWLCISIVLLNRLLQALNTKTENSNVWCLANTITSSINSTTITSRTKLKSNNLMKSSSSGPIQTIFQELTMTFKKVKTSLKILITLRPVLSSISNQFQGLNPEVLLSVLIASIVRAIDQKMKMTLCKKGSTVWDHVEFVMSRIKKLTQTGTSWKEQFNDFV